MRVFLLEDDSIYQDVIRSDLEKKGFTVDIWDRVEGACQQIKYGRYDLLCIDIILPLEKGMADNMRDGGIIVLEEMRKHGSDIPITIFVCADGYEDNEKRIMDLNLNKSVGELRNYFRKPYDDVEFLRVIDEVIKIVEESQK